MVWCVLKRAVVVRPSGEYVVAAFTANFYMLLIFVECPNFASNSILPEKAKVVNFRMRKSTVLLKKSCINSINDVNLLRLRYRPI